jgi:hypothetical protein
MPGPGKINNATPTGSSATPVVTFAKRFSVRGFFFTGIVIMADAQPACQPDAVSCGNRP